MENETKLFFLISGARAGKSTFANQWVNEGEKRVIVCSDDIRKALHGNRYSAYAETMVFAIKHIMIRSLLSRGFTVLVDGTHTSEISITRLLEIDPNAEAILIKTPKEECIKRAISLGQNDLIPVIERQFKNIDNILSLGLNEYLDGIRAKIKDRWAGEEHMPNWVIGE